MQLMRQPLLAAQQQQFKRAAANSSNRKSRIRLPWLFGASGANWSYSYTAAVVCPVAGQDQGEAAADEAMAAAKMPKITSASNSSSEQGRVVMGCVVCFVVLLDCNGSRHPGG
jgi:hypothetical protein